MPLAEAWKSLHVGTQAMTVAAGSWTGLATCLVLRETWKGRCWVRSLDFATSDKRRPAGLPGGTDIPSNTQSATTSLCSHQHWLLSIKTKFLTVSQPKQSFTDLMSISLTLKKIPCISCHECLFCKLPAPALGPLFSWAEYLFCLICRWSFYFLDIICLWMCGDDFLPLCHLCFFFKLGLWCLLIFFSTLKLNIECSFPFRIKRKKGTKKFKEVMKTSARPFLVSLKF